MPPPPPLLEEEGGATVGPTTGEDGAPLLAFKAAISLLWAAFMSSSSAIVSFSAAISSLTDETSGMTRIIAMFQ